MKTLHTTICNGVQTIFPVTFDLGYLDRTHIHVYVGDTPTNQVSYTWLNNTSIETTTVLPSGTKLNVRRITPRTLFNDYVNGAILEEHNLDDSFKQGLMLLEEVYDGFMTPEDMWYVATDINMTGHRITNVGAPVGPFDATNKQYIDTHISRLGLQYPPIKYAVGLTLDSFTKTYSYNGALYIWVGDLGTVTTGDFDETGWQPIQSDMQLRNDVTKGTSLIRDVKHLSGIFELGVVVPQYDGQQFSVAGFYAGSAVGGGLFVWDATRSKADHNGGTVIAPEAISAWNGTETGLPVLLNWSGSGNGCYVREHESTISPSDFGGKFSIQKILDKNSSERVIFTDLKYTVDGLEVPGGSAGSTGISLIGQGGATTKENVGRTVFTPVSNQSHLIELGKLLPYDPNLSPPSLNALIMDGFCFDGENKTVNKGLVHSVTVSQSKIDKISMRRNRGPGMYVRKLEDVIMQNSQFVALGNTGDSNTCTGALVFGPRLEGAGQSGWYETNIFWLNDSRFEWFDGGAVRLGENGRYNGVFIHNTKFEAGTPYDFGQTGFTYGEYAINYGVIHIVNPNPYFWCSKTIVRNSWFENLQNADCIIKASNFDQLVFENNILQNNGSPLSLFKIDQGDTVCDGRDLVFKSNVYRSYAGGGNATFNATYKSKRPCLFELPYHSGTPESCLQHTPLIHNTFAHQVSYRSGLTYNPDASDKTLGVLQSVAVWEGPGSTSVPMIHLGATTNTEGHYGLTGLSDGIFKVKVRAKKLTNGAGKLELRIPASQFVDIDIVSTKWRWYEVYLNLNEAWRGDSGVTINAKTSNPSGQKVYIDAVRFEPVQYIVNSSFNFPPTRNTWRRGDRIMFSNFDVTFDGSPAGAAVRLAGTLSQTPLSGVTASTIVGSNVVTVNNVSNIRQGMFIDIGAQSRIEVYSVNGNNLELSANMSSTGSFSVSYCPPVFSKIPPYTEDFT